VDARDIILAFCEVTVHRINLARGGALGVGQVIALAHNLVGEEIG
jgi:hypothetical protein